MSQNQDTPSAQKPQSNDPLASLHRMSTTAGVASQEYVAINQTAIATLLLGLAGISVIMANLLVVLPVIAVVCGIVALRQIANSNGTQSGRSLAGLGMVLGLVMLGYVVVPAVKQQRALQAEKGKIIAAVNDFGNALVAKDYDRAASMFDAEFFAKKQLTKEGFANHWRALTNRAFYGDFVSVVSNGRVVLQGGEGQDAVASTLVVFNLSKTDIPMRRSAVLKKDDNGQWKISDLPELFPTPPPQPEPGAAAGGPPR